MISMFKTGVEMLIFGDNTWEFGEFRLIEKTTCGNMLKY